MKKIIRTGKTQSAGSSTDPATIKAEDVMISKPIPGSSTHLGIKINLN